MRRRLLLTLLVVGVAAMARSAPKSGYQRQVLRHASQERSYYVHQPPQYDGRKPLPLLILLHGGGGNATQALKNYPLKEVADREGFILVAPNGTGRFPKQEMLLTWNVEFGFGVALQKRVDDTGFLRALIGKLKTSLAVDPSHIYLTGLSNGAILCHWAAAANSDLIAGIAPVVGTLGGRDESEKELHIPPKPSHPMNVILFNGDEDKHIPMNGGFQERWADSRKFILSAEETAKFWIEVDGCQPTPKIEELAQQKATRLTWSGGKNGTRVVLYKVHNQGHAWPGGTSPRSQADKPSTTLKAHEVMWEFFSSQKS